MMALAREGGVLVHVGMKGCSREGHGVEDCGDLE